MEFQTVVDLPQTDLRIAPFDRMLFVGSCFAQRMGQRFAEEKFPVAVNPDGVMYNPASVWHALERYQGPAPKWVVITLGTNRVYIENSTGQIVDNCQKRPQRLFTERSLSVEECADWLTRAVDRVALLNDEAVVVLTVSPIRYRKYGYHGSQLSKATLLLAADQVARRYPARVVYFPAYELLMDQLRDYRFYAADMIHPSEQAVEFIWQQFGQAFFSDETRRFLADWQPVKEALAHRPFHPESQEHRDFQAVLQAKIALLKEKYPRLEI